FNAKLAERDRCECHRRLRRHRAAVRTAPRRGRHRYQCLHRRSHRSGDGGRRRLLRRVLRTDDARDRRTALSRLPVPAAHPDVHKYGVVVAISANDGTRLFTPAAVGPDGGSTSTDLLPRGAQATSVDDDALSTTPTLVADSGAFAVGGVTLDDIFSAPPQSGGTLAGVGQFPTTRFNGGGGFSSGFGTRVNISAPSDNIATF